MQQKENNVEHIPIVVCCLAHFISLWHKHDRFMGAAGWNYASVDFSGDSNAVAKCPEHFLACSTRTHMIYVANHIPITK